MNERVARWWPVHRDTAFVLFVVGLVLLGAGCSPESEPEPSLEEALEGRRPTANPLKNAYFGDLHVHTQYSFDAYIFQVRATPEDAYRYARGEAIGHAGGFQFQLESGPFDFQAVTDHASYLGWIPAMDDPGSDLYDTQLAEEFRALGPVKGFQRVLKAVVDQELLKLDGKSATVDAWSAIVDAAEKANDPGQFTTFIGYEYTSGTDFNNLHRNVIFRGEGPELPFAASESQNPEDLWAWMDELRSRGIESLAIPHNSNGSGGKMFKLAQYDDSPFDADYAETRMRNEPLVEATQVKGDSETHPALSPNDEWADFETMPYRIATMSPSQPEGSYIREAYRHGIELEEEEGFNPFKFGLIGSTDTHNAGGTPEEWNYHSKAGNRDATPQLRGSVPQEDGTFATGIAYPTWSASGLAGIWAEENTRESLYDAMRRKETFATSGPRMRVRFFAGYDYEDSLPDDSEMVSKAYDRGVPMGADLLARDGEAPSFLVWASRDPRSAPLQRLQIVKASVSGDGGSEEQVFDVACSDDGTPDPTTHRCPDNGATVDVADCSISQNRGASELKTLWRDPTFDASQRALYYVRVLENPTCRWSTWDAIRAGTTPNPAMPETLQERAYSSPIWYSPVR